MSSLTLLTIGFPAQSRRTVSTLRRCTGQAGFVGAEEYHVANLVESHPLDALAEFFSSSLA